MEIRKLKLWLDEKKKPAFRLKQIINEVYKNYVLDFNQMTNLPKDLREILGRDITILPFVPEKILVTKDKKCTKALLKLADGLKIETVLIEAKSGFWTACVSSQVGCPLACIFCATGKMQFKRNLTSEEITNQVLFWQALVKNGEQFGLKNKLSGKVTNIVYMGIGEPLLNWENVKQSLFNLTDPGLFGFGDRCISVSTVGIPEGIKKFGQNFPQMNLAISLHSANNEKRTKLMPINRQFNLSDLKKSIENYLTKFRRQIFIEYIMIKEINDGEEDANQLVKYMKSIANNYLLVCNLITYNDYEKKFEASSPEKIKRFNNVLLRNNIKVTIRKSMGKEIIGACGQLGGKLST